MKLSPCTLSRLCALLSGILLPAAAHASALDGIIGIVAGPLSGSPVDGDNFGDIYASVMILMVGIVDVVGIVWIARAGLTLIISEGEDQIAKARKTIGAVVAALILINLAGPLTDALGDMGAGAAGQISDEVLGIADFFTTAAGLVAVIAIIVSGIRAVTSYGSEEGWTHIKRALIGAISGIVLIGARMFITNAVAVDKNPNQIIEVIVMLLNIVLGVGAFVATLILIYAGFMMIVNISSEDRATKAKNLIIRVGIGLIVILAALAIVNFVVDSGT